MLSLCFRCLLALLSLFKKAWGSGSAVRCQSSFLVTAGLPGLLSAPPLPTGSQKALQQEEGTCTSEHCLAISSARRNPSPPPTPLDFELDLEVFTVSAAFHQLRPLAEFVWRRPAGGRARHPGDAAAPQLTWLSGLEAPSSPLGRAHLNPRHTLWGFFLLPHPHPKCENNPEWDFQQGAEKKTFNLQWNWTRADNSLSLVDKVVRLVSTTCQNQTKHLFKRILVSFIGVS